MTIFSFALKRSVRNVTNMIMLCLLPFAVMFLPGEEGMLLPFGYTLFAIVLFFCAAKFVHLILEDRQTKVLVRIVAGPISLFKYLLQNMLAFALLLLLQIIVFVIGNTWFYGQEAPPPLLQLVVYSFFALSTLGFSLAWCAMFRNKETSFIIMFGLIIIMVMLGGLFWPIEIMPELLQRFAMLLPTYWLAESLNLIATGSNIIDLAVPLLMMTLFTVVFLVLGSRGRIH